MTVTSKVLTMARRRNATRIVVAGMLLALVAAACGERADPLDIGIKRVALDLAFKDPELAAPPVEPRVVQQIIYEEGFEFAEEFEPQRPVRPVIVRPRSEEIDCPTADPAATPAEPAFHIVRVPPINASWPHVQSGTVEILLANLGGKGPITPQTRWRVQDVHNELRSTYIQPETADDLGVPEDVKENDTAFPPRVIFTMTRQVTRTLSFIDTFMYEEGEDALLLTKRVIKSSQGTSEFNPEPPIQYMPINLVEGEGHDHGGVDRDNNIAMVVQSQVMDRQWVDVCGEVVDTYRVRIQERYADLSPVSEGGQPIISGNNVEDPEGANYWYVQYHNGIWVIQEKVKSTIRTSANVGGAPVPITLNFDYTSKRAKMAPDPPDFEESSGFGF